MSRSLVLIVMGEDKPGLVEALAETIAAHDGNWLESRMVHLAGKFAGVLRVSVPPNKSAPLTQSLADLRARGLEVVAEPSDAPGERFRTVRLELVGADHPGIVRDVSTVLAQRRINVEELVTECSDAPMSGQLLFRASAQLYLPAGVSIDDLRQALEALAHDLMVDIALNEVAALS